MLRKKENYYIKAKDMNKIFYKKHINHTLFLF
jgi:hypothetical protein